MFPFWLIFKSSLKQILHNVLVEETKEDDKIYY